MKELKPETMIIFKKLTNPPVLYSRQEIIPNPCPIPETGGLYAWYFKKIPPKVPTEGCTVKDGKTLLYIGICPTKKDSGKNRHLQTRIKEHLGVGGSVNNSTLRETLFALFAEESKTFIRDGEEKLTEWMTRNAYVCWATHRAPWEVEKEILESQKVLLPLNIQNNSGNQFREDLSTIRQKHKK